METYEEAYARTQKRIQNHIERYTALYGINPYREAQYALVINTETSTPTHIAQMIADTYQHWLLE